MIGKVYYFEFDKPIEVTNHKLLFLGMPLIISPDLPDNIITLIKDGKVIASAVIKQ